MVLFEFNIHSVIDIITNSSSELFVFESKTEDMLKGLIEGIYPDYLTEYQEPKLISSLSTDDFMSYLDFSYHVYGENKNLYVFDGFIFEDMYEINHICGDCVYFTLNKNFIEENRTKLQEIIDPENKTWLMYSIDDNPNWDCQEKLMCIGTRYHLG